MRYFALAAALLTGCAPDVPKPIAAPAKRAAPIDESRKMPLENRVSSGTFEAPGMGKQWLPGGTLAHYRKGRQEWDLILIKSDSPGTAAGWLLDYKKELTDPKLVPSFGGFAGTEQGKPIFVFTKGSWFAAIAGLRQSDADAVARVFASRLTAS